MTSGRLSEENRAIIEAIYSSKLSSSGASAALQLAKKLIASTGEFHSTNLVRKSDLGRDASSQFDETATTEQGTYKAVVYLLFPGGCDSWNMLVPHTCEGSGLVEEYTSQRGSAALDLSTVQQIDTGANPQPCSVFGVHPSLPTIASLYRSGEALFVSNMGYLSEPVDRYNYTVTKGARLGGHSSMITAAGEVGGYTGGKVPASRHELFTSHALACPRSDVSFFVHAWISLHWDGSAG